jgi:UDP-N-acetylmuramate dehydrogenase
MTIQSNADLKPYNTFAVSHRAAELVLLQSEADIAALVERMQSHPMPTVLLGGGSNVLFTQDYPGRVVVNQLHGVEKVAESGETVSLRIAAGENWHQLVMGCIEQGYCGIENLSLIPGSVGAAAVQNIGAYGVELVSVLQSVEAVNLQTGEHRVFNRDDCQLRYRHSIFKEPDYTDWLIVAVTLQLNKTPRFVLAYRGLEALQQQVDLTAREVSDTVIALRQSKLPDPSTIANGGSFFKNPVVAPEFADMLCAQHPRCPCFPHGEQKKLSAAWLLDQSGWKGHRRGDAGVYANHALVLVNHGGASGQELAQLASQMQDSVEAKFGIRLEPEVKLI